MNTVLETDRLLLREMSRGDLPFVAEMLAHPEVMQFWPRCFTEQEAINWIERQQARYARDGVGYWLALEKTSLKPVGQAGLMVVQVDGVDELGLGYILHRPYWGTGYAVEAGQACLRHAFVAMGKSRVIALVRPENARSQRVAKNLGMTVEKRTNYADYEHLVFAATSVPRAVS